MLLAAGTAAAGGILKVQDGVLRDPLDLYGEMIVSPFMLVAPVAAVLAGCLPLFRELTHRHIANTRFRIGIRAHLTRLIAGSAAAGGILFFAAAMIPGIVAFAIWPEVDPSLFDPSVYHLTPDTVAADALTRANFTSLLQSGTAVYLVGYSAWVAIGGATLAALGSVLLVWVPNRVLALAVPFAFYLIQTLAAALADSPQAGLMYSLFPFGLQQQHLGVAIAPVAALLMVTAAAATVTLRRAPALLTLS